MKLWGGSAGPSKNVQKPRAERRLYEFLCSPNKLGVDMLKLIPISLDYDEVLGRF